MIVRQYEERDRERVEEICEITDNSHLERDLLLTLYCHYYITYEKENCFVAVVDDKVVGYIISAGDTKAWIDKFSSTLLSSSTPLIKEKGIESTKGYLPYYPEYPAHLHIDIDPEYQRMGIGKAMMDSLLSHYKEKRSEWSHVGSRPRKYKRRVVL